MHDKSLKIECTFIEVDNFSDQVFSIIMRKSVRSDTIWIWLWACTKSWMAVSTTFSSSDCLADKFWQSDNNLDKESFNWKRSRSTYRSKWLSQKLCKNFLSLSCFTYIQFEYLLLMIKMTSSSHFANVCLRLKCGAIFRFKITIFYFLCYSSRFLPLPSWPGSPFLCSSPSRDWRSPLRWLWPPWTSRRRLWPRNPWGSRTRTPWWSASLSALPARLSGSTLDRSCCTPRSRFHPKKKRMS